MGWKNTGCFRARHNGLGVFTVGYHTSRGLPILCVDQMLCSAEHGVYPGPKKKGLRSFHVDGISHTRHWPLSQFCQE